MPLDLETFKTRLLARREALQRELEDGRGAEAVVELDQARVGRLSRMDALQAQALAVEARRRRADESRRITGALRRIDDDEFGWCVDCGQAIAPARLDFDPAASRCIACADHDDAHGVPRR